MPEESNELPRAVAANCNAHREKRRRGMSKGQKRLRGRQQGKTSTTALAASSRLGKRAWG